MLALGLYMHELPFSPDKFKLYAWHKSIGMLVLMLALLRLGWRAIDIRPDHVPGMPPNPCETGGCRTLGALWFNAVFAFVWMADDICNWHAD